MKIHNPLVSWCEVEVIFIVVTDTDNQSIVMADDTCEFRAQIADVLYATHLHRSVI